MSLRLAWLGPWNTHSAIAVFGQFVANELAARDHRVVVFRSETGAALDLPALPGPKEVRRLQETDLSVLLREFDGVIANLGDNFEFHGALPRILEHVPSLAIFHDAFLANFAAEWAHYAKASPTLFLPALVSALYGPDAWERDTPYWCGIETIAARRPMTEWLAQMPAGIVTHSSVWEARLRAATAGQVSVIPLAWPDLGMPPPRPVGEKLVVATIGHINPNKQANQILLALACDDVLRRRCEYRLLGPVEPAVRAEILSYADSLRVPRPVFTDRLSDDELRAQMGEVDVISCLRHPVLETGSASLLTGLLAARPVLVSQQGVYAELPDGLAFPCTPGREAADVIIHLRAILADPERARRTGERARQYALQTHSAAAYVDRLLPALAAATSAGPAVTAARGLGQTLGRLGLDPTDPAAARVAGSLSDMLGLTSEEFTP